MGNTWRGGEMSFDGTLIGLATTQNQTIFLRCPGTSVADALAAPNAGSKYCRLWDSATGFTQVETFAFSPGGGRTLIIPEGHRPRLGWTDLDYSDTGYVCPEPENPITTSPSVTQTSGPTKTPTPKPTVGPTRVPSQAPTSSATPKPSKAPTESPSLQPTAATSTAPTGLYPALAMVSNGAGDLGLCEADCDSDAQCQEGLICHVRDAGSTEVPGCSGNADLIGDAGEDFCILPPLQIHGNDNNITGLSACQADCDSNNDCSGDLVCYQRSLGSNMVPGCRGDPDTLGDGNEDYCILPTASFTNLEVVGNGLSNLQVCQADCDKDSDCEGSLLCYQRKLGMDKVPGCSGHADFLGDGTEDFCVHPLSLAAANYRSSFENSPKGTSDLAIIVIAFGVCAVLLAASLIYMKLKKRRGKGNTTMKDDGSIDMRTAATSLGASKTHATREELEQEQSKHPATQDVEGK